MKYWLRKHRAKFLLIIFVGGVVSAIQYINPLLVAILAVGLYNHYYMTEFHKSLLKNLKKYGKPKARKSFQFSKR